MANELLRMTPVSAIQEDERRRAALADGVTAEVESGLASHISRAWQANRDAKFQGANKELLECLRQRNGEYSEAQLQEIAEEGGSTIYMMLTATKVRAAIAWIRDILMPGTGERPWGCDPTPVPSLPQHVEQMIVSRIVNTLPELEPEQGWEQYLAERAGRIRDEVMENLRKMAKEAAERMEDKIADQMAEGNWDRAFGEFIDDFCTFPASILKGPIFRKRKKLTWSRNNGQVSPVIQSRIQPEWERVSPFDAYPSPGATSPDDGEFIERIQFTRKSLNALIGVPGYKTEAIRNVLTEHGRHGLRDWLWQDYERAKLEGKEYDWLRSTDGTIDGIHYWGSAQGIMLLEWGMDPKLIDDPLAEYSIDAIKIGRHVIRCAINDDPLDRRPYQKACFENVPGSFWGKAPAYRMRDSQKMCNAAARAIDNNMSISSGPQVGVNVDRMPDGEPIEAMYPWKIWQFKRDDTGYNAKPLEFFQPQIHASELMKIYEEFERRADDATGIPRYSYGNERVGGAGSTAAGLSMLMDNAAKTIKLAISNIDADVIKPTLAKIYANNMMYEDDPTIKGDVQIVASGSTALLTKETSQMRLNEILAMTANPIDMAIIGEEGRAVLLHEALKNALQIPAGDVVPAREEYMKRMQEKQQNQPPNPDMLKLEQEGKQKQAELQQRADQAAADREAELTMHREKLEAEAKMRAQEQAIMLKKWRAEMDMQAKREAEQRQSDVTKIMAQVKDAVRDLEMKKREPEIARQNNRQQAPAN